MNRKPLFFPFQELQDWYKSNGRSNLPWRDYNFDIKTLTYRVWLAETMLQQTQVDRVKGYFTNILKAFPSVEDLASTNYEDFFPYYKWLGYYSRARNMLTAARQVVSDFDWVFPSSSEELSKLKWVWPYTAEAILAFAYNKPTLSFDTNLEKIFSRYFFWNKFRKLTKAEKVEILKDFQNQVSENWNFSWRSINNALMDYWATMSLNSVTNIDWDKYPLHNSEFYKTRWKLEPVKVKKTSSFPNKQAYLFAILHENHKIYFSENDGYKNSSKANMFSPFLIWINSWNPRATIQKYFQEKYWLELSVRSPEIKSYKHETPYMICYCQIQSWKHNFQEFQWLKVRGTEEWIVDKIEFSED